MTFTATFFLSTGRCGTQWLARALSQCLGPRARVEHEPLRDDYQWRRRLAGGPPPEAVERHLLSIEETLRSQDYIESGCPSWSTLPYLKERLGERMRVVHLIRHPVTTALSWVSRGAYAEPILPGLPAGRVLLLPEDPGVSHPEYRTAWPELSRFEKCLWFWAEVHSFGLRLEQLLEVAWLRLPFEELFRGEGSVRLAEFIGGMPTECLADTLRERTDRFHGFAVEEWVDPARIGGHPVIVETAERLGYDPLAFDEAALRARYFPF